MPDYVLRPQEYQALRTQEPMMRGFVVFYPEDGKLISQAVISRKKADSILGDRDMDDVKIFIEIGNMEKKYVPYHRSPKHTNENFADMIEAFTNSRGFINDFLIMDGDVPRLSTIKKESGTTVAMPLELTLLGYEIQ